MDQQQQQQQQGATVATPTPKIGDRVLVGSTGQVGTLRYLGATAFREGFWAGVELDSESGKNDGTVQGISYFTCPPMRGLFIQAHRVNRLTSTTTDPIPTASGAFEAATDTTRKTLTEQAAQVPRQTPLRGPSPVALGTASLMPRRPASASNAGAASSVAAGTGTRPTTAQPVSTRGRSNSRSGADTKVPAQRVTTAAAKTSTTGTATAKQTALMNEIASTSVVPVDLDDLIDASSPDIKAEYFNTTSTAASSITTSRAEQYAAAAGSDVTVVASTVTPPPAIFNSGMADEAAPASTAGSGLADLDGIHISMQEDTDANMDPDFGTIPSVHSRSSTLTAVVDTKIIESLKKSAAERAASGGTLGSTGSRPYLAAASSGSHQRRTSSERQADLAATLEHLRLSRDGTAASSSRLLTQLPTKPTGDAATLGRQASIKSTSPSSSPSPAVMRMRSLATAPIPQTQAESSGSMEVHEKPAMPTGRDYTDQTDHTLFNLQLSDARSMVARLQEDLVHVQSQHRSEASMLRSQNAVLNDECTRLKSVVDEATSVAQQQSLEAERWLKETDRVKKSKAEMEAEHRKRLEEIDKQLVAFDLERSEELDKQREQYEAQLTQSRADYDAKLEREREKGEKLTAEREKWRNEAESTREKWTEREAELEQRQTVLDKKLVELLTTIDQLRKEKESWKQERTTIVGKIRDHQEEVKRVLEKEERKLADAAQEHAKREEEWFQEKAALNSRIATLEADKAKLGETLTSADTVLLELASAATLSETAMAQLTRADAELPAKIKMVANEVRQANIEHKEALHAKSTEVDQLRTDLQGSGLRASQLAKEKTALAEKFADLEKREKSTVSELIALTMESKTKAHAMQALQAQLQNVESQLRARDETGRGEISTLQKGRAELAARIQVLEQEKSELAKSMAKLKAGAAEHVEESRLWSLERKDLADRLQQQQASLQQAAVVEKELRSFKEQASTELVMLQKGLKAADENTRALQDILDAADTTGRTDVQERLVKLTAELRFATDEQESLSILLQDSLQKENDLTAKYDAAVRQHDEEQAESKAKLSNAEGLVDELTLKEAKLEAKLQSNAETYEKRVAALGAQLTQQQAAVDAAQTNFNAAVQEKTALQARVDELTTAVEAQGTRIGDLTKQVEAANVEKARLQKQVDELASECAEEEQQLVEAMEHRLSLLSQTSDTVAIDKELMRAFVKADQTRKEKEKLKENLAELTVIADTAKQAVENLSQQLHTLRVQNAELMDEMEHANELLRQDREHHEADMELVRQEKVIIEGRLAEVVAQLATAERSAADAVLRFHRTEAQNGGELAKVTAELENAHSAKITAAAEIEELTAQIDTLTSTIQSGGRAFIDMSAHYGEMQSTASLLRKQVGELSSGIFNFERSGTESADGLKSSLSQQVQELSNQVDDLTRVIQTGGHAYVQLMTRFEESEQTNNDLRKCVADLSSGLIHVEVENKESETAHALALARQKAKADAHVARIEELADVDRVAFSNLVQRLKESEQANLVLRKQVDDLTANVEALKIDKDENAVSAALSLAAQVKELTSQVEDLTEVVQAGGRAYNELCSRLEDSTQTNNLLRKHVGELSSGIVHVEVAGKEAENVHNAEIEELTHLIQTGGRAYLNISSRLEDTQMDNIDLRKQVGELSSGIIRLETDAKTVSADVVETLSKQTQELTDQVADLTRVIQSGGRAFTELSARFEETHDANNQLRRHVGELSSGIVHLEIENSEKETLVSAFEKQVQQLVKQVNGMSHGLHSSNHAYAELATIYEASTQTNNQLRSRIGELTTAIEQLKTESESSKAALAASLGEQISEFSAQVDDLTRLIQSSGRAFMELSGKFADTEETNNELRRQVGELSSGIIHAELDAKDAVSSLKQEFGKQVEELVSQTEDLTRVIQASGHAFNALSGRYEETQEVNTTLRRQVGELSSGIIHLEVDSKASSSENKKLSKQLDAMEQANTHLALVNDKLTKRIGELTQNINHGRSAIEDLSSRYEEAKQSNLTRAERLLTLTSDLERLTTEVNTVHTEYLSLSSKHGASLEENNSLRARAEVLGAQVQELTAKIEAKEKLVADMMKQCIVAVLQGSLVTRRVTELTSTLADKEKEMTEKLGSEREHFEKELGELRSELNVYQETAADFGRHVHRLTVQNNELTEECANRVPAVAISEYEERVEDLMRKLGELQASNAKLHEKNEELGGHSTALDTEMQALRAAFQSRVDRLEAEKLEALLEAAEVKKQMEESERQSLEKSTEVNAKLTTMEQQNEVLARKLAELYLLYSKNCEVLSEVEAKYEAIRVKFATAENRIRALQSTENLASTVFTDAEQELARLHAENDALIETRNQLEAKCTALLEDIAARNNTSDNGQRLSLQELGAEPKRRSDRAEIQALEDTLKANTGDSQILRQQAQLALSTALQSEEKMRMMIVQNRDLQSQIKKLTIERDSLLSRLDSSQMFATAGSQKLKLDLAKMTQQYNELQKQLLEYKAGNSGTVGIQAEVDKMRQENDRAAADVAASGLLTATTNMEALHQKLDLLHAENQHLSMEAEQAREAYKKLEAEKTQLVQDFLMSEEWDSQTSKLRGMMEREMENTEAMLIGKLQELEDQLVAREGKIAELNRDMQARMDEALEAQLRLHERIVTLDDELRQQKMVNALSAASVNQLVVEKEELAQYYDSALQDRNELARKFEELRRKHGAELSTSPPSATSSKTVPVDAGIVARRRNSLFNAVAAQAIAINKKVVTVHCANCNLDGDHESDACPKKVFSPPK